MISTTNRRRLAAAVATLAFAAGLTATGAVTNTATAAAPACIQERADYQQAKDALKSAASVYATKKAEKIAATQAYAANKNSDTRRALAEAIEAKNTAAEANVAARDARNTTRDALVTCLNPPPVSHISYDPDAYEYTITGLTPGQEYYLAPVAFCGVNPSQCYYANAIVVDSDGVGRVAISQPCGTGSEEVAVVDTSGTITYYHETVTWTPVPC